MEALTRSIRRNKPKNVLIWLYFCHRSLCPSGLTEEFEPQTIISNKDFDDSCPSDADCDCWAEECGFNKRVTKYHFLAAWKKAAWQKNAWDLLLEACSELNTNICELQFSNTFWVGLGLDIQ